MGRYRNGKYVRTIGEQIDFLKSQVRNQYLVKDKRKKYKDQLNKLLNLQKRYGVIYMEDERFFRKSPKDGHFYIIEDIDYQGNIYANRVSHRKFYPKRNALKGFPQDGSKFRTEAGKYDRFGKRLNVNDAYDSHKISELSEEDKITYDKYGRKKEYKQ